MTRGNIDNPMTFARNERDRLEVRRCGEWMEPRRLDCCECNAPFEHGDETALCDHCGDECHYECMTNCLAVCVSCSKILHWEQVPNGWQLVYDNLLYATISRIDSKRWEFEVLYPYRNYMGCNIRGLARLKRKVHEHVVADLKKINNRSIR